MLKLQSFGHLITKSQLIGKDADSGERLRTGGEGQRMRSLDGITDSMEMSLSQLWETVKEGKPGVLQSMGSQRVRHE